MNRSIFITGASSGLGRLTAIHFAKQGWNVVASMRNPEKETGLGNFDNIRIVKLDVTDTGQAREAVKAAISHFGKIDVVINNAGLGMYGALELADEKSIDQQYAVNVKGPINVIRAFLPHFRENNGGMFINISSFMGVTTALPVASLYNMSKFALEGLTEGLYYELKSLNIGLRLVEQGGSRGNNFRDNIVWSRDSDIKVYDEITSKVRNLMESMNDDLLDDPQTIVDVIHDLATGKSSQFRTIVGETGKNLVALRNTVSIEEYLDKIAHNFQ